MFGRIFTALCALNGVVIVSMMVLAIMNSFEFDPSESRTYVITGRVTIRKRVKQIAGNVIGKFSRLVLDKKKGVELDTNKILEVNSSLKELKKKLK